MPNSSNAKVSPRKFSEKIALLVKKEAESNAKFDEIIKEVQATRNQTVQPRQSCTPIISGAKGDDTKARVVTACGDEIEEIYEDIIKFVDNYESAFKGSQHDCEISDGVATHAFQEQICDSTTLSDRNLVKVDNIQPHSVHPDQSSSLVDLNAFYQCNAHLPSRQDNYPSHLSLQSIGTYSTPQANEDCIYRPRVTSIGSAYQRCLNLTEDDSKQMLQDFDQESNPFLKPYCNEKNWQKSCSDPSLSLASLSANDNRTTCRLDIRVNQTNCSNSTHANLSEEYAVHMVKSGRTKQPTSYMTTDLDFYQQKRDYPDETDYADVYQDAQHAPTYTLSAAIASDLAIEPLDQDYGDHGTLTSLPGIKICSISDGAHEILNSNDARNASRNRSLSDIQCSTNACLQQNNQAEGHFHSTTDGEHMVGSNSASMQPNCTSLISMNDAQEQQPETIQPICRASSACSNFTSNIKPSSSSQMCHDTPHDIFPALSSNSNSVFSGSYPRVQYEDVPNGSLSVGTSIIGSNLGLVHPGIRNVEMFHNIMRSHSHGGIDRITRKVSNKRLFEVHAQSQHSSEYSNVIIADRYTNLSRQGSNMCYSSAPTDDGEFCLGDQQTPSIETNQELDYAAQHPEICLIARGGEALIDCQLEQACDSRGESTTLTLSTNCLGPSGKLQTLAAPPSTITVLSDYHANDMSRKRNPNIAYSNQQDGSSNFFGCYESPTKSQRKLQD